MWVLRVSVGPLRACDFVLITIRLENTHSDVQQSSSLQFNPKQRPDLFWEHTAQKHNAYFEPGLRAAITEDVDEALGKAAVCCFGLTPIAAVSVGMSASVSTGVSVYGDGSGSGASTSDILSPTTGSAVAPSSFTLPSDNQDRKLIGQVMKVSTWEIQPGESYRCGFCS